MTGFRVVTRFGGDELDTLVTEAGFEVQDARWFPGLLPLRYVEATHQPME